MNLKLNGVIFIIGLSLGVFAAFKLIPHNPTVTVKEKIVYREKRSGTIKRHIKKDGSIDEIEQYLSEKRLKKQVARKPDDNLLFLTDTKLKEASILFKLEHLYFGFGYDPKEKELLYKLGYSTRIF